MSVRASSLLVCPPRARDGGERDREEARLPGEHVRGAAVVRDEGGDDTESTARLAELRVRAELVDREEHERQVQEEEQQDEAQV